MDVAADTAIDSTRPAPERLMPLGIAMLGWLVCAGVLVIVRAAPAAANAVDDRGVAAHLGHFLVPFLAGLLYQSSVSRRASEFRLRHAGMLWGIWTLVGLAASTLPERLGLHAPWSVVDLGLQQAGLVVGIIVGWLGASVFATGLVRVVRSCEAIAGGVIVVASIAIMLIPLAPETLLLNPVTGWQIGSSRGYAKAIPGQLYLALKSVILWVPLGMLYAIARKQVQFRAWTIAGALAFLLAGLPLIGGTLAVRDAVEILGAYWGIVWGIRLGIEVRRTLPEPEPDREGTPVALRATSADATRSEVRSAVAGGELARRITAVVLLVGVAAWSWFFPRWGIPLMCGLALYAVLLWRYRHAWLFVVPAALPLLNLAPGSGRFFLDEFDLLMVTTVAMALWHGLGPLPRRTLARPVAATLALFGLSIAVSLVIGLLPLSPLDTNAFTDYWSHYNSLRIAKGLLWALPLLALMLRTPRSQPDLVLRLLVPGMWLGLAGVVIVGLWERALFANLLDLTVPYRITATFSSMHTGGSEIETYLVTAIPFVWLAFQRERPAVVKLAGLCLLVTGAYLMTLTIARAGVLALGVALCLLVLGAWRATRSRAKGKRLAVVGTIAMLGVAAALAVGLTGGYLQKRLADSERDWAVRVGHWQEALAIRDQNWITTLFGMGLGRFPEAYLFRAGTSSLPGTYRYLDENGNHFLRLWGGETLYMAQRVPVSEGRRYTLALRVRSSDVNVRLGVPVCEKQLLNSRQCAWQVLSVPGDGSWHTLSIAIDSGTLGAGNWLTRRPVELSLYNETERTRIDVDDVQLTDDTGRPLIQNGNFSAGGDYWFFKTHSHLPWHIKNLWVAVLFEQGWFGLVAFVLLTGAVGSRLARALWRGDRLASVLLAAMGGFLTVGVFGSLFDTARIATLFFLLVVLAGTAVDVTVDRPSK